MGHLSRNDTGAGLGPTTTEPHASPFVLATLRMNGPETTPLPRLRAARTALHAHGVVPANLLVGPVARSWQRCVERGLSPSQPIEPIVTGSAHLRSAVERHSEMLAHARPVLDFLHEQIRDTGSLVVLADADGVLLHAQGDETFVSRAARVSLRPGACWGEAARGTNAVGTALLERAPVVVHGGEHFLDAFGFLTCSAAPILDSSGRALGVVDISGHHRARHPHTLALVRSAARMIEDRVFLAQHAAHWRVHLHARLEGLGTVGEGLVALTEDGWIVGANAVACSWLGLGPGDVGACTVHGVFGLAANELLGPPAGLARVEIEGLASAGQIVEIATCHRCGDALLDDEVDVAHEPTVPLRPVACSG